MLGYFLFIYLFLGRIRFWLISFLPNYYQTQLHLILCLVGMHSVAASIWTVIKCSYFSFVVYVSIFFFLQLLLEYCLYLCWLLRTTYKVGFWLFFFLFLRKLSVTLPKQFPDRMIFMTFVVTRMTESKTYENVL